MQIKNAHCHTHARDEPVSVEWFAEEIVNPAIHRVETALRGEETSSCVTVPPRRKYCVRVMRFMITLGPHGMSMPRQVPGWPRKCSPKTRINYEGVQSAFTQLVQKPQSSDS